ncbi:MULTISPECIES: SymE family type I addiction module toxin [Klebsiella]
MPWLNVSGLWLEAAGFKVGDALEITVTQNTLNIKNCSSDGITRD